MSSVVVMMQMHRENQLKKQTRQIFLYCNLESKNPFIHLHHHHMSSRQITSDTDKKDRHTDRKDKHTDTHLTEILKQESAPPYIQ